MNNDPSATYTQIVEQIGLLPPQPSSHCGRPEIVVACILDQFSFECFKYECTLVQLNIMHWRAQLDAARPHFVLVESAWHEPGWGIFGWDNAIDMYEIGKLVRYCKEAGIPTVFWNKEDPVNYFNFIGTAKRFDIVFTTDSNCLKPYRKACGHSRVFSLPFAAQPAIHNPAGADYSRKRNVAFSGTYYKSSWYPEREADSQIVLKPALPYGLHIYDRHGQLPDYEFPELYKAHIVGYLDYAQMVKAYRLYKIYLNVNSVKYSPTMFSRRVYELLASGTNVISSYALGIAEMFPGIVPIAQTEEQTAYFLETLLRNKRSSEKLSLLGLREVHAKHLYKHRFDEIWNKLGMGEKAQLPLVTVIAPVSNPQAMTRVAEQFGRQTWENKQLILLARVPLANGQSWSQPAKPNVRLLLRPADDSVEQCFHMAVKSASGSHIAVFHENHYYAPAYLTDLMHAFRYTDADMVGKAAYFSCGDSLNAMHLANENRQNRYVTELAEHAWIMKKQLLADMPSPAPIGNTFAAFLEACGQQGRKLYSSDPFNYAKHAPPPAVDKDEQLRDITV
ncbi:glycosyltransferase [Paenibacillus hodogayensis]|uniref:Glycosyltransferase n=1 Tax=Paenibacillus hodogayensis TaxID=279208 RepID=A0ABV5W332_9BACL